MSPAETLEGLLKPKHQTNQEAPQKPKRRSLILITPDVPSQSANEQKEDTPPTTAGSENLGSTLPLDTKPKAEAEVLSGGAEQGTLDLKPEPNSQLQKSQPACTEPINDGVSAESVQHTPNRAEADPNITAQEIQTVPLQLSTPLTGGDSEHQAGAKDITEVQNETEDKHSAPVKPEHDAKHSEPQTLIPAIPKVHLAQKVPSASVSPSSMCLQEAIRLKTAALSSTDNQVKRRSVLHSPPLSTGPISPTSTANFIFSKSPKKVGIERLSLSSESKLDVKKTLAQELNSVSQTSKPAARPHDTRAKVPPPVAKKPSARGENITHHPSQSNLDTEHVQTAGQ